MKFTIDYNKWRAGGDLDKENIIGKGPTQLLNDAGYMCCLGQVACQLGASKKSLLGIGEPIYINEYSKKKLINILLDKDVENNILTEKAIEINDDITIATSLRIQELKELFLQYGHELEFINVPENI